MGRLLERLKNTAKKMKQHVYVLLCAYRDRRTPWFAKALAFGVAAYAFSPVDLIPDFIPLLGYLDDLVLIPLGVALVLKLIPAEVLEDSRRRAEELRRQGKPVNWLAGLIIVLIWLAAAVWLCSLLLELWMKRSV